MSDLLRKLAEVRQLPHDPLPDARVEQAIRDVDRVYRRQQRTRALVAAAIVIFAIAGSTVFAYRSKRTPTLTFADGSTAALITADSEVRVADSSKSKIEVVLERGSSRFDVVHDPQREFRVAAGDLVVEVIGTQFVVSMTTEAVDVRVERGRVRVHRDGSVRFISQGESATFTTAPSPPKEEETAVAEIAPPPAPPAPPPVVDHGKRKDHTPAWRASSARGNYDVAYGELKAAGPHSVRDIPEELMVAANVARWSNHPADAVPYLQRVINDHKTDPRAQLAAFTLGRVFLEDLARPRDAANAFARARALGSDGPLEADALAREVESWSRAGDAGEARARAEDYLRRYPDGPHVAAVRHFGGL